MTGFILVASALMTFGTSDRIHDADSLLPAIMSLKKLTWYYWSQNRFGNLLPFLASPVRGMEANFYLQVYLRHVCGFVSILTILQLAGAGHRTHVYFFVSVLLLLWGADGFIGPFFNPALSQPVSCAVFALGLWPTARDWQGAARRMAIWTGVTAVFWVAFFVNVSLVVLVLPLGLACWLLRLPSPLGRPSICAAMLVAGALAWLHARQFYPHTPAGFRFHWDGLNVAAGAIASQLNLTALAAALAGSATLAAIERRCSPVAQPRPATMVVPMQHIALLVALVSPLPSTQTQSGCSRT